MRDLHWLRHDVYGQDGADQDDRGDGRRVAPGKVSLTQGIHRSANGAVSQVAGSALAALGGSAGSALPEGARSRFEASLGADLGDVRVHTGPRSESASTELGARAFTTGRDIHFGAGLYQPDDPFGLHLLAHEVAHTVQQGSQSAGVQTKLEVSEPGDAAEVAADAFADHIVHGGPVPTLGAAAAGVVHRAPIDGNRPGVPTADATYVAQPSYREIASRLKRAPPKPPTAAERPGLFARFTGMLRSLEKNLEGNARQAWGWIIYGTGDGKHGPATKAAMNAKISGTFDYAQFMEDMGLVLIAIPKNVDCRKVIQDLRRELNAGRVDKVAAFVKRAIEKKDVIAGELGIGEDDAPEEAKKGSDAPKDVKKGGDAPKDAKKKASTKAGLDLQLDEAQWISGSSWEPGGAIAIFTDKRGTQREVRYWFDKDGYMQHTVLKITKKGTK